MADANALAGYSEPTAGANAARVRIIRAEMQSGSRLTSPNALVDGDESIAEYGEDNQHRATSSGDFASVSVSVGPNNTSQEQSARQNGFAFRAMGRFALYTLLRKE